MKKKQIDHLKDEIDRLKDENRGLYLALLEIAGSKHQEYKNGNMYSIGVADGHRHCVMVAKKALAKED